MDDESRLREMVRDSVSEVHPTGSVDDVWDRAERGRGGGSRRWLPVTVAAAAVVLVIGGAVWVAEQQQGPDPTAAPASTPSRSAATPTQPQQSATGSAAEPAGRDVTVPVYYVGDTAAGPRLFREFHRVPDTTDPEPVVAVEQALTGTPDDPDYRGVFPAGSTVRSVEQQDGVVVVDLAGADLSAAPAGVDDAEARQAVNALVYTVNGALQRKDPVAFRIDGQPARTLLGVEVGDSVPRASEDQVKAAVSVFSPAQGQSVTSPFEVQGEAAAFEANVVWELKQGDRVVRHGFTTAEECCTLAPYSFTVEAPPGDYLLVVHDTDVSDGEGVGTSADTKAITVAP